MSRVSKNSSPRNSQEEALTKSRSVTPALTTAVNTSGVTVHPSSGVNKTMVEIAPDGAKC